MCKVKVDENGQITPEEENRIMWGMLVWIVFCVLAMIVMNWR